MFGIWDMSFPTYWTLSVYIHVRNIDCNYVDEVVAGFHLKR
jgi:hypothetical protein